MYSGGKPVTRVLALSPAVDLASIVRDMHELHRALGGLLQVSVSCMGRYRMC